MRKGLLLGLLALMTPVAARAADVVDQISDTQTGTYWIAAMLDPLGQEFVPTLSQVDWVEMWCAPLRIFPNGTAQLTVEIHAGEVSGSPLAQSDLLDFPVLTSEPRLLRFEFNPGVPIVPGSRYVMVVRDLGGCYWAVQGEDDYNVDAYPAGSGVRSGAAAPSFDLWFREGTIGAVHAQLTTWGHVKALYRP
jgi:hypothetical protein